MKRALIILAAIALIILLVAAPLVFAVENESSTTETTKNSDSVRTKFKNDLETLKLERSAYRESKKVERAAALKTKTVAYAEKQIDVRLRVLTEQEKRLSSAQCSKITSIDVKTPITNAIASIKTELDTALVKIKAAENADIARTELKAAIEKTRVFMYLNPAISGLCKAGKLSDRIANRFDPLIVKIKAKNIDTTILEKELASAKTSLAGAIDSYKKVLSNPSSTANKDHLATAKSQLQSAKTALTNFKVGLAKIADEIKGDNSLRSEPEDSSNSSSSAPIQAN